MAVITWQNQSGVAVLLPFNLRTDNPADLDMSEIVYEAPSNAHRQNVYVRWVRSFIVRDPIRGPMGLASASVPEMLRDDTAGVPSARNYWFAPVTRDRDG